MASRRYIISALVTNEVDKGSVFKERVERREFTAYTIKIWRRESRNVYSPIFTRSLIWRKAREAYLIERAFWTIRYKKYEM